MPECVVCSKDRDKGTTYQLTPEEKQALGAHSVDEVFYCDPCHKLMQDPTAGAQFLKGMYEMTLRQFGVGEAEKLAQDFHTLLRTTKK